MAFKTVRAVVEALPAATLTPTERFVLLVVADAINHKSHYAWPTQETLCAITGLARSSLNRALKTLEATGVIRRKWRGGTSTVYTMHLDALVPHGDTPCPTVGHAGPNCVPHGDTNKEYSKSNKEENEEEAAPAPSGSGALTAQGSQKMKMPKGLSVSSIAAAASAEFTGLTDDEILDVPRVNKRFTAEGLEKCWRRAHGKYVAGFQPALREKDRGQLVQAYKRVGDLIPQLILLVTRDWNAFARHAEKESGAFKMPTKPSIGHFLQYVEAAASLALKQEAQASKPNPTTKPKPAKLPVQLIAKPTLPSTMLSVADIEECDEG